METGHDLSSPPAKRASARRGARGQESRDAGHVLYITTDGVLEPLGFSQVARVLFELRKRGFRYTLLSAERESDLARAPHVERVAGELRAAGIDWMHVRRSAANRSLRNSTSTLTGLVRAMLRLSRRERIDLVHARGPQAATLAFGLHALRGTPYLFDLRGCWIDERSGVEDWFFRAAPYATGKYVERRLIHGARAIVTLTSLHATDIAAAFQTAPPLEVIPTCADFDAFKLRTSRPGKPDASAVVPAQLQALLRQKLVVALVGALNRSYRTEDALRLALLAARSSPRVHLLILSKQVREHTDILQRIGFPLDRATVTECTHEEMPEWMQWIDWSLMLLDDTAAKRGSMPTKLAEFFASGVRTVAYGCNSEMTSWVRRAGSGHVLEGLESPALVEAARVVTTSVVDHAVLRRARELTEAHFGLSQGAEKYTRLLRQILP